MVVAITGLMLVAINTQAHLLVFHVLHVRYAKMLPWYIPFPSMLISTSRSWRT